MQVNVSVLGNLIAACAFGWLCSACQIPGLDRQGGPDAGSERAGRQSRQGDHATAAKSYEAAARAAAAPKRNALWLTAATEWLAAGDDAAAETAIGMLAPPIATADANERVRIEAEIALARGETQRAATLMRGIADTGDEAALATRAHILFETNRVPEAVSSLIARDRLLTDAAGREANQRLILDGIRESLGRGADVRVPADADALLAGWLELGRIVADATAGALGVQRRVQTWRSRYPAHPASEKLWRGLLDTTVASSDMPRQIALLLPLSGKAEAAGIAVRDGFLGAYYEQDAGSRPRLRIYDVAARDAPSCYLQAIADGSDFVVGPLTREEVAGLASLTDGRTTTLALNFLPDGVTVPERFYQFALSPEDEARQVARRAIADGHLAGLVLVPQSDWGRRVQSAFAAEFAAAGSQLLDQADYAPGITDFNDLLQKLLQTDGKRGSTPRADAQFIFVAAQPMQGRLIRTQLRFNYATALPVYATSDIYDPAGKSNVDLDGVMFLDMPWVLDSYGPAAAARESTERVWPDRIGQRGRLHAFGYDAFRLVGELRRLRGRTSTPLAGFTGRLAIDGEGRVHRELDWAQIVDGRAVSPPPLALPPLATGTTPAP
jgi:outer membrane PBP1 activator LpoA protein